jgi:ATP-dependent helicase/DNAse subunit B
MNINHISVSRYDVWQLCKQLYKFRYHLNIKTEESEPFYFLYGNIVHRSAEEYVLSKGKKLITEIANEIIEGKIPLEKKGFKKAPKKIILPEEYKRKLPLHLAAIMKITEQIGFDGKTEYEFEYDLDPPNKRLIVGYIDRIIIKENKFWILDYKTTKKGWWRKDKNDILTDLQLRLYARVIQKQFNAQPENIKAGLYYVEGEELIGACFSSQSLAQAEKELLNAYLEIENMHPDDAWGRVGDHCKRCEYRKICPFYSLT